MIDQINRWRVWSRLVVLVLLSIILIACALFTSVNTPSPPPDGNKAPGATEEPQSLASFTPTVAYVAIVVAEGVDVHSGPGYEHPIVITIDEPITVRVIAINPLMTWFFILLPDNQLGWVPIEALDYDFDIAQLPVVKDTPLTPTPYGNSMLVPPQLLGVGPSSPSGPARGLLSSIAVIALGILTIGVSGLLSRQSWGRRPSLARLFQILIALF